MNALQRLVLAAATYLLIACACAEGIVGREYLPVAATAAAAAVVPRKIIQYPSYYKPLYNQYQQTYYPQYTSSYYPQYNNGFLGAYQQQALGQQITTGTSLALPGLALGSYYPNLNVDLLTALKPRPDVIDTVYDATGGYVYGKKK